MESQPNQPVALASELIAELQQVEYAVQAGLSDLQAPFAQLVQSQWRRSTPLVRAAFVLTAGYPQLRDDMDRRRIYLGAAIEMLRLALAVHIQLLTSEVQPKLDRSLLGSTVLAGDFCFSRSAGLAAKTDSPIVVDIFAQSLQRVSEGTLRRLFRPSEAAYDEDRELTLSGVAAAHELAGLAASQRSIAMQLAPRLLSASRAHLLATFAFTPLEEAALLPHSLASWQALLAWLHLQA